MMISPYLNFVQMLPDLYEGYVSWKRLSEFLSTPPDDYASGSGRHQKGEGESQADVPGLVVRASNVSIGWTPEAVLKSMSFDLTKRGITLVTGGSDSGKSTLMKALLGEVNILSGSLEIFTGRIAFCDQTPFFLPSWLYGQPP